MLGWHRQEEKLLLWLLPAYEIEQALFASATLAQADSAVKQYLSSYGAVIDEIGGVVGVKEILPSQILCH